MRVFFFCSTLIITGLCALSAVADRQSQGRIAIYGSIVDDGCKTKVVQNQLAVTCQSQGKPKEWTQSLVKRAALPGNVGKRTFRWLSGNQDQGLLTVSYH